MCSSKLHVATRPGPSHRRGGYTLVELVAGMAAGTVLMGGLASAMFLVTGAIDTDQSPQIRVLAAGQALQQMSEELSCATAVKSCSQTGVSFTLPDRDGDGVDEKIIYAWSGTRGDSMTRQYNDAAALVAIDEVYALRLDCVVEETTEDGEPTEEESEEFTLLWNDYSGGSLYDFTIDEKRQTALVFWPSLGEEVISWSLTRVYFKARAEGKRDGVSFVEIREVDANSLPGDDRIERLKMEEENLSDSMEWQQFTFQTAKGLSPDQGLSLVVREKSGGDACAVQYEWGGEGDSSGRSLYSFDKGKNWDTNAIAGMHYYITGTVTTEGEPTQVVTERRLTHVNVSMKVDEHNSHRLDTRIVTWNKPAMPMVD